MQLSVALRTLFRCDDPRRYYDPDLLIHLQITQVFALLMRIHFISIDFRGRPLLSHALLMRDSQVIDDVLHRL